jgi:hypothetical protein
LKTFRVLFKGGIASGYTPDQVKHGLAKIFTLDANRPTDAGKLKQMLSGRPVVIKAGLSREQARQYQQVIAKTGAVAEIGVDPANQYYAPGYKERRHDQRRIKGDRRGVRRTSSILPDRRASHGRRSTDPGEK